MYTLGLRTGSVVPRLVPRPHGKRQLGGDKLNPMDREVARKKICKDKPLCGL